MKCTAFVTYLVQALLLDFGVEFRKNLHHDCHTLLRLLPAEYEERGGDVKKFEEVE